MKMRKVVGSISVAALLAGCGGGGSSGSGTVSVAGGATSTVTPAPTPTPTPTAVASAACSLRERQDWVSGQLREWYLFPETLPATLDPTPFTSVSAYVDALTATARGQRKDRFFTYVTSIAEENAFYASGSTAGFGIRIAATSSNRIFISEAFEGAPALNAGIDRGTEVLAIGTSEATLRTVSSIIAAEGTGGINAALGPNTAGTTRTLRVVDPAGGATRVVTIAKADFELPPVSSRYGSRIIDDGGKRVGYINLRTFISTADPGLRAAFANFRAAGVTELIVDLRYNGGGLVSIAHLFGDLLGRNRSSSDVLSYTTFRPEKASQNDTRFFRQAAESIAPTKIAFIGMGGSASASELVINAMQPYLRTNMALVGANTFGKPVGQIALDRASCDDRLRVVAFRTENAERRGDYYNGLATTLDRTCVGVDDVSRPLGDPQEASIKAALDFLGGRACTPIGAASLSQAARQAPRDLLTPDQPSAAQREVPGLF
jgi:carboxyl-terminal processing protease